MKTALSRHFTPQKKSRVSSSVSRALAPSIRVVQFGERVFPRGFVDWQVACRDACRTVGVCAHWPQLVGVFQGSDLRYVVSTMNGTGLSYVPEPIAHGVCPLSFPGKAAALLYQRYVALHADVTKGLVFLPCESAERNGDQLRAAVLEHAQNWALPGAFATWVREANRFCNTRLEDAATGRWVIEAPEELGEGLRLPKAGVTVVWMDKLATETSRG